MTLAPGIGLDRILLGRERSDSWFGRHDTRYHDMVA